MNSFHMESMWKTNGIHVEKDGIHVETVWNPCGKTMESIHQKYGIHPPFHGIHPPFHGFHPPFHGIHLEFLQSTPHSMDSIWIILGRVKYRSRASVPRERSPLCPIASMNPEPLPVPPLPAFPSIPVGLGLPPNTPLPYGANIAFMWSPSGNTLDRKSVV